MNAGDVVVRFIGETSALEASFESVEARQKFAADQAAMAALEMKAAQKELRLAMQATQAQGGMTGANLERVAEAEKRVALAAAEAAEAQATLKTSLGIGAEKASLMSEAVEEVSHHLAGMLGLMAVVEGVKEFIEHIQESTLKLDNLSKTTGINIVTLAGFRGAGERVGVEMEGMGKGINKLVQNQTVAIQSTGKQRDAFASIGITVKELRELSPEELFLRVGEALGSAEHKGVALNAAATLMGRGIGQQLLPVFISLHGHLKETIEAIGEESGVTAQAGDAARDWQGQLARMTEVIHAGLIPVMIALVPVIKVVESAFGFLSHAIKLITDMVGGVFLSIFDGFKTMGSVVVAAVQGQWSEVVRITKDGAQQQNADLDSIGNRWKQHHEEMTHFLKDVWGTQMSAVIKDTDDNLSDLAEKSKKTTDEFAQEAKKRLDAVLGSMNAERAAVKLMLQERKLTIGQASIYELDLIDQERRANEKYFDELIAHYKKLGNVAKVKETEDQRSADRSKASAAALTATAAAQKSLEEETRKYGITADSVLGNAKEKTREMMTQAELLDADWKKFIPDWVIKATEFRNALKAVGVEGVDTLRQKFAAAQKAEDLLNHAGMTGGKAWLQVQKAKLEAAIAIEREEAKDAKTAHTRTVQMQKDLDKTDQLLKKFGRDAPNQAELFAEAMQKTRQSVAEFSADIGTAFAAVIQGQEGMAQAVLASTGKMISAICDHWAQLFIAMAIADMWGNPGKAAAELAAAAALKMAGALAGSMGSGGGGSDRSADNHPVIDTNNAAGQSGPNPTGGRNVPRMAAGGLVTSPTLLMAGDARMGGASSDMEGILPLHNRDAMDAIASAIAARMGGAGTTINVKGLISGDELSKVVRKVDRQISRRQARLTAGSSFRVTPRG